MITTFQRIALSIEFLRLPALATGILSLLYMAYIVSFNPIAGDRYLIPTLLSLLWGLTTFSFISSFRSVPEKPAASLGFVSRVKRNFSRCCYWLLALLFTATSLAILALTVRMVLIWLKDYGGGG